MVSDGRERKPMNESEWQECTDPEKMLAFLQGKVSERIGCAPGTPPARLREGPTTQ